MFHTKSSADHSAELFFLFFVIFFVFFVPFSKAPKAFGYRGRRFEVEVSDEVSHVGVGLVNIAGLHGEVFFLRFHADGFFECFNEIHQFLRLVVPDVVDLVAVAEFVRFRRIAEHVFHAADDVIDIGEVAEHVAVIVDLDRLAADDLIGEFEVRHVRPPPGSVDSKEAQARGGDAVEMAVGVGHELIGFLRRRVEADGMIHIVRRREGRFLLIAVHGGAGRIEEMLHRVMTARFEDIEKSYNVRLDVRTGIVDTVAHARLRGKVHHDVRPEILKKLRYRRFIGEVAADEGEGLLLLKNSKTCFLERHVVVVVQIVDAADSSPQREESLRQMKSDESRRAGNEHFFRRVKGLKIGHGSSLVPREEVAGVYFFFHISEIIREPVRHDDVTFLLECRQVVYHAGMEEIRRVQRGLINDDFNPLCFNALHHALNGGSAEIVGGGLHGESVDADDFRLSRENHVSDVVFPRAVRRDDGGDKVLRHVAVVREKLLRILREAVAAVAEGGVIVEIADARIEADTFDDLRRIQAAHFRIGVELIEVGHTESEIGIRKKLDRFRFGGAGEEHGDVLLDGPFGEEMDKGTGPLGVLAHDDAGGVEVVVERLPLAEKFRGKDEIVRVVALLHLSGISHGHGGFNDHDGIRIDIQHFLDDALHGGGVEEVLVRVIVRGRGNDDIVRVGESVLRVEGRPEMEGLLGKILRDLPVHDGRLLFIQHLYFFGNDIQRHHIIVLRQQYPVRQAHIARPCDSNLHHANSSKNSIYNKFFHKFSLLLLYLLSTKITKENINGISSALHFMQKSILKD